VYLDHLKRSEPGIAGVISATTGNHGQSIAYAATRLGLVATIVVPHGNSPEKNRAMAAFGATLVEHGHDFQAAYEYAVATAALDIIRRGAARIVTVSEAEMRAAMRILFSDTHNVAEGAGAAPLAAALQERGRLAGKRVAAVVSGGNIDRALFAEILAEADLE